MKMPLIILVLTGLLASPVFAEKPEWAGNEKPTAEQKEAYKAAMKSPIGDDEDIKEKTRKQKPEKTKDLEKQKKMKSEQVQKELSKGSDQGQESREQRKKWWRFWGE